MNKKEKRIQRVEEANPAKRQGRGTLPRKKSKGTGKRQRVSIKRNNKDTEKTGENQPKGTTKALKTIDTQQK